MKTNCKNPKCRKELIHTPGRRPKEFCSPECRVTYHNNKNKPEPEKRNPKGRPKGSKNKINLEKYKRELELEKENRSNPLISAARGRDSIGVNLDENKLEKEAFLKIEPQKQMPKGLSLMQQLEWREKNQK